MSIKIIEEPDIYLTQEERDQLFREWKQAMMYTAAPVSFEIWVRQRRSAKEEPREVTPEEDAMLNRALFRSAKRIDT